MVEPIPPTTPSVQDVEHLRTLSICHYVLAGLAVLGGCFPLLYVGLGIMALNGALNSGRQPPPPMMGWVFIGIGVVGMLIAWGIAVLLFIAGRNLVRHTHWTFCFVMACISCLQVPLGTVLGVFTIVVLSRPSVKALFEASGAPPTPPATSGY